MSDKPKINIFVCNDPDQSFEDMYNNIEKNNVVPKYPTFEHTTINDEGEMVDCDVTIYDVVND